MPDNRCTADLIFLVSVAFALLGWLSGFIGVPSLIQRILYALAIAPGAWPLLLGAGRALRGLRLDMSVLMCIATAGACALGDWAEAATLVILYSLAERIEAACLHRSRAAINKLAELSPAKVLVRCCDESIGSEYEERNAANVQPGTIFMVRAGERVALDGVVVSGASHLDQSAITGESWPAAKAVGDEVFAGTLNGNGALEVRATRPAAEGATARIAHLVQAAERDRPARQRLLEKLALWYTPVVIVAATFVAVAPPLLHLATWPHAIYTALSLLVAACPCALLLGGPITTICALSSAARNGVLIRGGAALETLAAICAIAYDKTGTLTHGRPQVTHFTPLNGLSHDHLAGIAATLESRSSHPLAVATVDYAQARDISLDAASDIREVQGRGVSGTIDGVRYCFGRRDAEFHNIVLSDDAAPAVGQMETDGHSVAVLSDSTKMLAAVGYADAPRPEAQSAFAELRKLGIEAQVILSGDTAKTVAHVAEAVGADKGQSNLLPEDKVAAVRRLREQHGTVAMVGDGINDAPALAAADVAVVLGMRGTDAALDTADVVLMADNLFRLPLALRLARRARRVLMENYALAVAMKLAFVIGLLGGAWGHFGLIGGVIADVGATVLVTVNGLRLLRLAH